MVDLTRQHKNRVIDVDGEAIALAAQAGMHLPAYDVRRDDERSGRVRRSA